MKSRILKSTRPWVATLSLAVIAILALSGAAPAQTGVKTYTGSFADHATYLIEVPQKWNGTLFVYSHGYVAPGTPNPPADQGGDVLIRMYLLTQGYALSGSSYASTGWAVEDALSDQIAVLDTFNQLVGHPSRTIAWGHSLGGLISEGLVQNYPNRFSGALPLCGVGAGSVGLWNQWLDSAFAFNTLLASGTLQVVNITDQLLNFVSAENYLTRAQVTPQGQARTALAAALADSPGWIDPLLPPPSPTDYTTLEANQYQSLGGIFLFYFTLRAELEQRAGGNPSWNTGVDYEKQVKLSTHYAEVQALYQAAGLSLDSDLKTLNNAARISADPGAVSYLSQNIAFNGEITVPVLTVHTEGDDVANVQNEQAYAAGVHEANNDSLLRQTFVHRAGHCNFTTAETIAALETLVRRLDTGQWQGTDAKSLNETAATLPRVYDNLFGPGSQQLQPAFSDYVSAVFLRPYDGGGKRP
jgi:pimeloyl-ACP methyl ester carboxylesterase